MSNGKFVGWEAIFWVMVCWIVGMRCRSFSCVGLYLWINRMEVRSLLVIVMVWKYELEGGRGVILVMFVEKAMDLCVMVRRPPLVCMVGRGR